MKYYLYLCTFSHELASDVNSNISKTYEHTITHTLTDTRAFIIILKDEANINVNLYTRTHTCCGSGAQRGIYKHINSNV